ncbi:MAG: ABC transporter substrate-binding protein [Sterolibacteriaceae bacterium]|jgi:phospholipid transport system substrate-binding protein|nr:ABC transporter substrate-binding protein [Sterolibacteriaceae bacterium]MBK9083986.1 ABC transporter substrate-binding protein [Sterolibacteriaceae bacterium]
MNRLFTSLLFAVSLLPGLAVAQNAAPDALVKTVTDEVLQIVRTDKAIQSGSTSRAIDLVEQKVLPHFDFMHMTRLAVGKDWRSASPDQQKALAGEFKTLLVRTYSNALTSYKDQAVEFKPFKMQSSDTDVLVRSEIRQPTGRPVQLDYNLAKEAGGWKVYDVIVAGVSLVTNYREQFAQEVRAGGIDGLVKSLKKRNAELSASNSAAK